MSYLGQIIGDCDAAMPYTGTGNCPKQEGVVSQLLLTALDADFPADKTAFLAQLDDSVSLDGNERTFPVKGVVGAAISGGDVNAPDLGTTGGPRPIKLNAKNQAFQIEAGDCQFKELSKMNGRKMRLFRLDNTQFLYGTAFKKGGEVRFRGFEGVVYVTRMPSDGSTNYNLTLTFYYATSNEREELNLHAIDLGRELPDGLIGVMLAPSAGSTSAMKVVTACGGDDITGDFGPEWAETSFVNATGTNPTTVTYNAATKTLTFAPAGSYKLASAVTLAAMAIGGIEGVNQYVAVTAAT